VPHDVSASTGYMEYAVDGDLVVAVSQETLGHGPDAVVMRVRP
jgi:hypothetical protein